MRLLLEAHCYCLDSPHDIWQFAVGIADLKEVGLNNTDLRWLSVMEYVVAADEVTPGTASQRKFQNHETVCLSERTCFVPTTKGVNFAQNLLVSTDAPDLKPVWDAARRELRILGSVVKRFNRPSGNQQRVIEAFDEAEWRFRINDPLPAEGRSNPKLRLRQTIKALNRNQKTSLIRFSGDGTGGGVCWQVREVS